MTTRHRTTILLLLLASSLALSAAAQEMDEASLEILVSAIQSNKEALVAVNLPLTEGESAAFWPVYNRYQTDLGAVQSRFVALIEDYSTNFPTMSDAKANEIVATYLDLEHDRANVRRQYLKPFSEALPGRKVARFYQIENKMDAVLRYRLASEIPVIEAPSP